MASTYLKYMGSKRAMLTNGLGEMLNELAPNAHRFIDLFSGSGTVGTFVAERHGVQVISNDLQCYSKVLAASIIERTSALDGQTIWKEWDSAATSKISQGGLPPPIPSTPEVVSEHRSASGKCKGKPVTRAYGGHYFSMHQAIEIDALRSSISRDPQTASLQLAALILAASQCVAAPGHTAQPFQPSSTGIPYIAEAWRRSVRERVRSALEDISNRYAVRAGRAIQQDANLVASECMEGDLVFIDPPYSGVHYSRFYHVLETIAEGKCGAVSGKGRYPAQSKRPKSDYSMRTRSLSALDDLFGKLARRGASAIVTFPDRECSNGMSGNDVRELAKGKFAIREEIIETRFSSMGGRSDGLNAQAGRNARVPTNEIVFHLQSATWS